MSKREKKLTQVECEAILNKHVIGTLSMVDGDRPYAVQLEYLFHEGALYMGTYMTGRKMECMNKNDRAVFTVFEDRHGHPEMIKQHIWCRSVMAEGRVGSIHIKEFTNRQGETKSYRLLKFEIESLGSWQCSRKVCNQAIGFDPKKMLLDWLEESREAEQTN